MVGHLVNLDVESQDRRHTARWRSGFRRRPAPPLKGPRTFVVVDRLGASGSAGVSSSRCRRSDSTPRKLHATSAGDVAVNPARGRRRRPRAGRWQWPAAVGGRRTQRCVPVGGSSAWEGSSHTTHSGGCACSPRPAAHLPWARHWVGPVTRLRPPLAEVVLVLVHTQPAAGPSSAPLGSPCSGGGGFPARPRGSR